MPLVPSPCNVVCTTTMLSTSFTPLWSCRIHVHLIFTPLVNSGKREIYSLAENHGRNQRCIGATHQSGVGSQWQGVADRIFRPRGAVFRITRYYTGLPPPQSCSGWACFSMG